MIQKTVNIILIIYISLVFAILIGWFIIYYIIFPMPKIMELVPDSTVAYIDITDLDSSLAAVQRSEFVDRVARSQLWTSFKSSRLWQGLSQDIADLQNLGLDRETIMRLVGRHSIVSFYVSPVSDQQNFSYLLISELDVLTRLVMASGQIERLISPEYTITKERYRGIKLITVKAPDRIYIYAFVGRAGFLSSNISLVKKTIDIYKQGSHSVSDIPEFSKLTSALPVSDTSFYINAVKFQESSELLQRYGLNLSSLSLINRISLWAGAVYHENGKLRIDNCFLYRKVSEKYAKSGTDAKIGLPLPNNSLAFVIHKSLKPEYLFNLLERNVSPRFAIIRNGLLPIVYESVGEALLVPNTSEYQILPPLLFFMRVRNKVIAETTLNDFKMSLKMQNQQMEFNETLYDGVKIHYLSYLPGVPLPIGIGYAFIQNDILVLATDMSALKSVIDVLNGKSKSIIEQTQYLKVMNPIGGTSDNAVYIKLKELSPVVEQVAKLYLYQSMITGNRKAEKLAVNLADNAFILESWNYLGTVWTSDEDKMNLKITLSKTN
jgi:hypothetical protein